MANIINSIQNISDTKELEDLIKTANKHLRKLKTQLKIRDAESQIRSKGYYLDLEGLVIPNTRTLTLFYNVKLSDDIVDFMCNSEVIDSELQKDWVKLLGFKFDGKDINKNKLSEIVDNASSHCNDNPYANSCMHGYLYFPENQTIPINTTFRIVYDNSVGVLTIINNIITDEDGEIVSNFAEMINDNAFIVPANLYI